MTYLTSAAYIHKSKSAVLVAVFVLVFVLGSSLASWPQIAQTSAQARSPLSARPQIQKGPIVIKEFMHVTGPPLREVAPLLPTFSMPPQHEIENEIENNVNPNHNWSNQVQKDPVLQTKENSPRLQTPTFGLEFEGGGYGDSVFCNCMPPDNDGAAGTTQYVQYVNTEYQVFDKRGNTVLGPLPGNAFWSGLADECQTDDNGDVPDDLVAAAPELSVTALAGMIPDPALLCIDTRGSMAYRIGHLPGSVKSPTTTSRTCSGTGARSPGPVRSCSSARQASTPGAWPPSSGRPDTTRRA